MFLESVEPQFSLYTLTGWASFAETERLEAEILAEAEVDLDFGPVTPARRGRTSPTTFHIAVCDGAPIGVATSTVGSFAELPLGLALVQSGLDPEADLGLPDPTCELVSVSVDSAATRDTDGVTEALYRSFYRHAKLSAARSAVVGVDPWVYDVLTEEYGIPFRVLGPPISMLGRELLAIGGRIDELEAGIQRNSPSFFEFLDAPYGDQALPI